MYGGGRNVRHVHGDPAHTCWSPRLTGRALAELVAAAGEGRGFGGVSGKFDGFVVGGARLSAVPESAQQVGAGRVVDVVVGQLLLKAVDGCQRDLRAVEFGEGDGPVQGDDR